MPGGAANVVVNVAALGGRCHLIGLCGTEPAADALTREISSWPNVTPNLVQSTALKTTVKTRFIDDTSNRHLLRHDREYKGEISPGLSADLEYKVLKILSQVDVVVLSD